MGRGRRRKGGGKLQHSKTGGVKPPLQNGHHRNFQVDSGGRHARGLAVHFRSAYRLQPAVYLVRHSVCLSWREEDEGRASFLARGWTVGGGPPERYVVDS